ncbi:MAG: carboxypeptidase regulatory-like domain-containing protein [Crocinitomicaceae bacterium]|nr:carboxypeptidase regulatory-like domain-containing protein [Crocinitomicaceae bacterium]
MIRIKYNCPESLDQMPKTECGFYCDTCSKNIYDFRGNTFEEIEQITKEQHIRCGIFDRDMAKPEEKSRFQTIFRLAFAAVFLLGFNASMLFGQTQVHYPADPVQSNSVDTTKIILKGTVYDHNGNPIKAHLSYFDIDEVFYFETNDRGEYEVELSRALADKFYLTANAEDMESKYLTITLGEEGTTFTVDIHMEEYKEENHQHDAILGFY